MASPLFRIANYWLVLPVLVRYGDSVDDTVEENSSVFSLIRMCWLPSARASAAERNWLLCAVLRRRVHLRRRCRHGAQQQTRRSGVQRANDGTDRQTDRRTDVRQFHRACSAYSAISVNKDRRASDLKTSATCRLSL